MTYTSTVPAVVAALTAALQASPSLAGVPVHDGPELTDTGGTEGVAVGYTGDQATDAVTGTATREGLGVLPDREQYSVFCVVEVIDPGGSTAAARARAYQLHAACGAAVAADHTLAGTVLRASTGFGALLQQQTTGGALARVVFPVDVDAYTSR